jgi:aspartate aminotransferase
MGLFNNIPTDPPIEVFHLTELFNQDANPSKVNLGIGVYQDENGKTLTLPVVRSVEQQMAQDLTLTKNYLKGTGLDAFCSACLKLVLGEQSSVIVENRACSIQSLSGTGALRIGLDFLYRNGFRTAYVSAPTWGNHDGILQTVGFEVRKYRYWSKEKLALDIDGLIADLEAAPEKSVVILHACAHNPTGCDPTHEQWIRISDVCKSRQLVPFFDLAYQGFSTGDLDQDAWAIRYFAHEAKHELFVAQSFAKNFSLYNERVGHLIGLFESRDVIPKFRTQMATIIRRNYSNPPAHGAYIVANVLNNSTMFGEWKNNVRAMYERIHSMRQLFYNKLKQLGTPGTWEHIIQQTGMFAYTGLNLRQCQVLIKQHHIYIMSDGRINVCAITAKNVDEVAQKFYDVITNVSDDPTL